jgi:hypothetical protein
MGDKQIEYANYSSQVQSTSESLYNKYELQYLVILLFILTSKVTIYCWRWMNKTFTKKKQQQEAKA